MRAIGITERERGGKVSVCLGMTECEEGGKREGKVKESLSGGQKMKSPGCTVFY